MNQNITGEQLLGFAKKQISDKAVKQAVSDPPFNDFIRICILMSMAATMTPEEQTFGHTFTMQNQQTKEFFSVDFDIKVTSKKKVVL